ncbi:hypothetical protein L4C31_01855 [Aliivibrio sifiae]
MKNKRLEKQVSKTKMVVAFLEKDLNLIKHIGVDELDLSVIESVLTQSLIRLRQLKSI